MRRNFLGNRFGRKTGFFAMALVMIAGLGAMGALVMWLWNWLMPTLFTGAGQIDYWRALGLLLLSKLLFGGFGGGGRRGHWHARREHWESMTPDERAQFREHFKSRWGSRFGGDKEGGSTSRSARPASGNEAAGGTPPQDPSA